MSFIEKATITSSKLDHDSVQRRTKREDFLHLALQTYCRFTRRIHSIPLSLPSKRCHCALLRFSGLLCRIVNKYWYYSLFTLFILVMIKCTAVWLECARSRSSIQCRLSRIRYTAITMENGSRSRRQTPPKGCCVTRRVFISTEGVLILIYKVQPVKHIRMRNPPLCRLAARPWHVYHQ